MDDILKLTNAIFSLIGWAYIMFKAGGWIGETFAKKWCKRRKDTVRQKAVDALYDAYELGDIEPRTTVRLATKDGLTIMMFREEKKVAKQVFYLRSPQIRQNLKNFIDSLPLNPDKPLAVTIQKPTRSLDQNAKLWATLRDISEQVVWYGRKMGSESWKCVFTAALKKQETVPGIDGGFVVLGQSTSKMTVGEMRDLIELINAFGVEHGVKFSDESRLAIEWANRYGDKAA